MRNNQIKVLNTPMERVAVGLYKISRGRITPNGLTWAGVLLHIPIAFLIAKGYLWQSGILVIVFGLFDMLDGALARYTKTASAYGMVLDASTDRVKETLIHAGIAYYLIQSAHPEYAVFAVLALGLSLSMNYLKSKAEAAYALVSKSNVGQHELNRMFSDGIFPFEIKTAIVAAGLFTGYLVIAEILICLGAWQSPRAMRFIKQSITVKR